MNGCQGTKCSEELDGKELYGALGGELQSGAMGIRRFLDIVDLESTHFSTSTASVV